MWLFRREAISVESLKSSDITIDFRTAAICWGSLSPWANPSFLTFLFSFVLFYPGGILLNPLPELNAAPIHAAPFLFSLEESTYPLYYGVWKDLKAIYIYVGKFFIFSGH